MKSWLVLAFVAIGLLAQAQLELPRERLAYIKNTSVVLENLQSKAVQTIANSSGAKWFSFTGSRIIIWRDAGLFVSMPPYQTANVLSISAQNLEGINSIGERLFLAYRRPNSSVLSYQTVLLTTMQNQPSAFFPETSSADGTVFAYRSGNRIRVLRGSNAETALEFPESQALNWGVSPPALTPNGKGLVFAHNNGTGFSSNGTSNWQLYVRNLQNRTEKSVLKRNARIPDGIVVSPDGTRALVSYSEDKKNTLEIVNLEQGFARTIHQNFLEGVAGAWSSDGRFVLAENIAEGNSEIFFKDLGGQTLRTIVGGRLGQWIP